MVEARKVSPAKVTRTKKNGLTLVTLTRLFCYFLLVRLAGIEPTTPWFVAKYSIQLSYSREAKDYITSKTKLEHVEAISLTFRLIQVLASLVNLLPQRAALFWRQP